MSDKQQQTIENIYQPATAEDIERWAVEVFGGLDGNSAVASIVRLVRAIAGEPSFAERDMMALTVANQMYGLTTDHSEARDRFIAKHLPPPQSVRPALHC